MNSGEEMVAGWLQYCKGCQLVQCNVRSISCLQDDDERSQLEEKFKRIQTKLEGISVDGHKGKELLSIFKRKNTVEIDLGNLLKQTEIDVVGYDFANGQIWACEVADHRQGCLYGRTAVSTVAKIIEKMLKVILFWWKTIRENQDLHLNVNFVTPKISEKRAKLLKAAVEVVKQVFEDEKQITIELFLNGDVNSKIYQAIKVLDSNSIDNAFVRTSRLVEEYANKNQERNEI